MIENLLTKLNPADLVTIGTQLEIFYRGEWGGYESGFFCGEKGKVTIDFGEVKEVRLKAKSILDDDEAVDALVSTAKEETLKQLQSGADESPIDLETAESLMVDTEEESASDSVKSYGTGYGDLSSDDASSDN